MKKNILEGKLEGKDPEADLELSGATTSRSGQDTAWQNAQDWQARERSGVKFLANPGSRTAQ